MPLPLGRRRKKAEKSEDRPEKLEKLEGAIRLDEACVGCFPGNRKGCAKDVWATCCGQEISCHDDHCRGEVLGKLKPNAKVRVHDTFISDDEARVEIVRGMTGKVLEVDEDGDSFIKFWRDELDDEYIHHWVFKRTGWDKLELPGGGAAKMRATRTVSCLDNCTLSMQCIQFQEASKKKQKKYADCIQGCKMDDCNADEECKPRLQAYADCKQRIGSSGVCAPLQEDKNHPLNRQRAQEGREADL